MNETPLTGEEFLKDVANHKLTVKLNKGLYRHLHWSKAPRFALVV